MTYLQKMIREKYMEIVEKHGNGKWAFDELEWWLYVQNIDMYESFSEEEQWEINTYMQSFRSLYK